MSDELVQPSYELTLDDERTPARGPRMLILEGPPGTGKTYLAAREAVAVVDGRLPVDTSLVARYRQLVNAGLIVPVTFHPSYTYEDFVEGYRPRMAGGVMDYPVMKGPFLRAVDNAAVDPPVSTLFRKGMALSAGGGSPYVVEEVEDGGVVLSRPNTRQDAVNKTNYYYAPFWTVARILSRGVTQNIAIGGSQYENRRELAQKLEMAPDQLAGISHISAVSRYVESQRRNAVSRDSDVVLLIDEINRADLSRVFGELITLVESDKRKGANEERSAILPYSGRLLTVPKSLHIIGTMNTADRSLSVFDYALRRRFDFEYVAPDPSLCPQDYGAIDVAAWLRSTNERISGILDRDACLGHAEFMEVRLDTRRRELDEPDAEGAKTRAVAMSITKYALPTLLALSGRNWTVVRSVLGDKLIDEDFQKDLELDDFDTSTAAYRLNPECDPTSPMWNADKLVNALRLVVSTG